MKYLILILTLCSVSRLKAQTDSATQALINKKCKPVYCTLDDKLGGAPVFKNIEVIDFRPDTARIGIVRSSGTDEQLRFKAPTQNTLAAWMNARYAAPAAPHSFLLVLRKLWNYDSLMNAPDQQQTEQSRFEYNSMLAFRGEVFANIDGGWLPVTYLDTIVDVSGFGHQIYFQLPAILSSLVDKISHADIPALKERRKIIAPSELTEHYRSKYTDPIYQSRLPRKGVYMSIQEFRDNQPSVLQYDLRDNRSGYQDLYIADEHGQMTFTRSAWGLCDGEKCYVMMDGNLFPVLRAQNAFYILGSKEYRRPSEHSAYSNPAPIPSIVRLGIGLGRSVGAPVSRKMRFFRLDVDSGEIY